MGSHAPFQKVRYNSKERGTSGRGELPGPPGCHVARLCQNAQRRTLFSSVSLFFSTVEFS